MPANAQWNTFGVFTPSNPHVIARDPFQEKCTSEPNPCTELLVLTAFLLELLAVELLVCWLGFVSGYSFAVPWCLDDDEPSGCDKTGCDCNKSITLNTCDLYGRKGAAESCRIHQINILLVECRILSANSLQIQAPSRINKGIGISIANRGSTRALLLLLLLHLLLLLPVLLVVQLYLFFLPTMGKTHDLQWVHWTTVPPRCGSQPISFRHQCPQRHSLLTRLCFGRAHA